jgi:hypothetical protein
MGLVIVGYALGVLTGMASVGPMRWLKYSVLLLSILYLFKRSLLALWLLTSYMQATIVLGGLFVFFALISSDPALAVARVLMYVVPFFYVVFSVGYLLLLYPITQVLHAFINAINWVYLFPIVSFFITGGKVTDTNIYDVSDKNEDTAFVSNHYGWASTLFLLTSLDLLRNVPLPRWRKLMLVVFCLIAAYLVLISGNRTSWLSLLVVAVVFIFKYRKIVFYQKVLLSLLPLGLVLYLLQDPDSAINVRLEKTRTQQKKGEPRVKKSMKMISYFNKSPNLWVTGIGVFNKKEIEIITGWSGYHNSYFEVLFGAGIPVFLFFLFVIAIRPVWFYIRYFATYYLFFLPLLIIPYFESNLTGGQFLFFPWFIMAILISYSRAFARIKLSIKSGAAP